MCVCVCVCVCVATKLGAVEARVQLLRSHLTESVELLRSHLTETTSALPPPKHTHAHAHGVRRAHGSHSHAIGIIGSMERGVFLIVHNYPQL